MQAISQARFTRGLAVATALAVGITCGSPTSPNTHQLAQRDPLFAPGIAAVATVTVKLLHDDIDVGEASFASFKARDANGRLIRDFPAAWTSDNTEVATVDSVGFIRGVGAGTANIIATVDGVSGQALLSVGGAPPPPVATQLAITTQPVGGTTATPLPTQPLIEIRDANGTIVPASSAPVTASIASGVGVLGGTTTVTAVNGVVTFSNLTITGVGVFTLAFTSSGLTQATSNFITVSTSAATQLAMVTQPSATAANGTAFATQPMVGLRDALNNAVSLAGISVTASIASGGGTLGGTLTALTDASGVATFTNLSITGAVGTRTLAFSAAGLVAATSIAIMITPGSATRLAMTQQPSSTAESGSPFVTQPVVALLDASSNLVSQSGVNVTATIASGGGTLGGTATVATDASGLARFTNLSITGTEGTRTLAFSAGSLTGITSNPITITAPPPPDTGGSGQRTIVFASDWSTATGTSDAARRDLGKAFPWGGYGTDTRATDVVPATGLNFPTTNVFRVLGIRTNSATQWLATGVVTVTPLPYSGMGLGDLAVGQSFYYRMYKRVVYPPNREALGNGNHPVEETAGGGQNWAWTFQINSNGWRPRLGARVSTRYELSSGGSSMNPIYLARDATYRLEWQIRRTGATTFEVHARIYDAAGTLLYDDDDFVFGTTRLSTNPQHLLNDPLTLRRFEVGTNGPSLLSDPVTDIGPMWYIGAVAVCRGTWCGPYVSGERP